MMSSSESPYYCMFDQYEEEFVIASAKIGQSLALLLQEYYSYHHQQQQQQSQNQEEEDEETTPTVNIIDKKDKNNTTTTNDNNNNVNVNNNNDKNNKKIAKTMTRLLSLVSQCDVLIQQMSTEIEKLSSSNNDNEQRDDDNEQEQTEKQQEEITEEHYDDKDDLLRRVNGCRLQYHELQSQVMILTKSYDPNTNTFIVNDINNNNNNNNSNFNNNDKSNRSYLFGNNANNSNNNNNNNKDNNTMLLSKQNDILTRAKSSINETKQVAKGITTELSRNRKTIENSSNNTSNMIGMTNNAKRIISNMTRRKKWMF